MINKLYKIEEKALTTKDRNKLPDDVFGLPKERKYPMPDEEHVRKAIQFFIYCPKNKKKELANNINKMAKKFNMKININDDSPFFKYIDNDIIKESISYIDFYISKEEFDSVKESDFGLKESKTFPLSNIKQIINSIQYFYLCPIDKRPELARNINTKILEKSLKIKVDKKNPFYKYTNFKVVSDDGIKVLKENFNIYQNNKYVSDVVKKIINYKLDKIIDFNSFENFISNLIDEVKKDSTEYNIISIINKCAYHKYKEFDKYKKYIEGKSGFDYFTWIEYKIIKDIRMFLKYKIYDEINISDNIEVIKKLISNKNNKIIRRYVLELILDVDNKLSINNTKVNKNNKLILIDLLKYIDNNTHKENISIDDLHNIDFPMPSIDRYLNKKKNSSFIQLNKLLINNDIDINNIDYNIEKDVVSENCNFYSSQIDLNKITEGLEISSDGDIKITLNPKKSFMDEYAENHKLLISNYKNKNYEGMKQNLAFLFALINFIEREYIYNKKRKIKPEKIKDAEKARMFALNDFKKYLKELQRVEPTFDFTSYYMNSGFDKIIINIKTDSIVGIKKMLKKIILS